MSETPPSCPFVGLAADPTLQRSIPDDAHRCFALVPPGSPDVQYQQGFCLTRRHTECPFYQAPETKFLADTHPQHSAAAGGSGVRRWLTVAAWCLLILLMAWVASVYLRDSSLVRRLARSAPPAATTPAPTPRSGAGMATPTRDGEESTPEAGPSPSLARIGTAAVLAIVETPAPDEQATETAEAAAAAEIVAILTLTPSPEHTATTTMTPAPTETATATATPTGTRTLAPTATPTPSKAAAVAKAVSRPTATRPARQTAASQPAATKAAATKAAATKVAASQAAATKAAATKAAAAKVAAAQTPSSQAPSPAAQPTATTTPAVPLSACPDTRAQITSPKPGGMVSGVLALSGRAAADAFAGYVVEFAPGALPDSGYDEVFRSEVPVENGPLASFVINALPKGTYTISLRVLTSQGEPPPPCKVVFQAAGR